VILSRLASTFLLAALVAVGGCAAARAPAGGMAGPVAARIARIERGLLPTVAIRGRRDTTYTLADRMRRYGTTGVSLAVIDGGRIAWARGYGSVDSGGAAVDTATLFQAGSISKAITAIAALREVDRRVLALDEDVNARLESWRLPPFPTVRADPVTLRRLLSHSAGLNVPSYRGYRMGTRQPTLQQILSGTPPANTPATAFEIAPGADWRYSGAGLTVVQQLLEDVTRRPFAEVLREDVFAPFGMSRSNVEHPLSPARAGNAATGQSGGRAIDGRWMLYPELAAAGVWSTAPDLARFGIGVMRAVRGERGAWLAPATGRALATRQKGDWGIGFALGGGAADSASVGHDGSTAGFIARVLVLPRTQQGIAIMANGENDALMNEIERAVAREYAWPVRPRIEKSVASVDPAGYDELEGHYRVEFDGRTFDFTVRADGGRLLVIGASGRPAEVLPLSAQHFFSQDTGNEFTFTREGARITAMRIDQQGQRFTARRMP
jgi:CubicO group peptidase (beta-lactamase class C family)